MIPKTECSSELHLYNSDGVCDICGLRETASLVDCEEGIIKPKIITLCGSTRFIETFAVMAYLLEKEGAIVLGLHLLPESYFKEKETVPDHIAEYENVAEHFDNLHLRKIDISDSIYVLNIDGYIGKSTRREIDYAEKIGKPVTYLETIKKKEREYEVGYGALHALQIMRDEPDQEGSAIAFASDCAWHELYEMKDKGLIDMGIERIEKKKVHPFITEAGKVTISTAEASGIIKLNLKRKQKLFSEDVW